MKKFIIDKIKKQEVILWNYKEGETSFVGQSEIDNILKNMTNEYKFKDTSGDWKDYC